MEEKRGEGWEEKGREWLEFKGRVQKGGEENEGKGKERKRGPARIVVMHGHFIMIAHIYIHFRVMFPPLQDATSLVTIKEGGTGSPVMT